MSALLLLPGSAALAGAASEVNLVWSVETLDGKTLDSRAAGDAINPASVVKLVTSLRALATLRPEHRFETRFATTAAKPPHDGRLTGDLVVVGGGDPDFHFENAMLVARQLLAGGVRQVHGDLIVDAAFWIGWERGSAGRETDPDKRALQMGERLRAAWNPAAWSSVESQAWAEMAARRGWSVDAPPRVVIDGVVRVATVKPQRQLVVHRSEPLLTALHRFNVFSNNDIERLDFALGPPSGMASFLARRWGIDETATSFETSSGLGRNRISPRLIVRVLRDLHGLLSTAGLGLGDLLPVMGCGESTLMELFLDLKRSGVANGMAGKTGTLNTTDGGVAALAGMLATAHGQTLFLVAAPGAGPVLKNARAAEEKWVTALISRLGHGPIQACPSPVGASDAQASVATADTH